MKTADDRRQMVEIDGGRIRRLREERGLTQLYVATVVGVTTDTVSRWENGRYPAMRRENAEKLARALEVDVERIRAGADSAAESAAAPGRRWSVASAAALAAFALGIAFMYLYGGSLFSGAGRTEAVRLLPGQAAPGSLLPLVIEVRGAKGISFILKERLPPEVSLVAAEPAPRRMGRSLRWIAAVPGRGVMRFSCLLRVLERDGLRLSFRGILRVRDGRPIQAVDGNSVLVVAPFFWADVNRDHRIDDDEILAAYEMLGEGDFFAARRLELDDVWTAPRYRIVAGAPVAGAGP